MSMLDNIQGNIAQSVTTGGIAGGVKPQPVGGGTANQYVNGVRDTSGTQPSPAQRKTENTHADTILGMSNSIFYGVAVGAVIVIGVGFYLYKRQN